MGDGVYSAGTIFLQVVPVFKDVQEKISRNARDWDKALGDELEKSGKSAGERANKALGEELGKDLDKHGERAGKAYAGHFETSIKAAVKNAQRELDAIDFAQVKKKLHSLDDGTQFESVRRGARTASDDAIRDFERVQATLTNLSRQDFSVDFDEKKLLRDVQRSMAAVDRLLKGDHELAVTTNLLQVMAQLEKAEKRFDEAAARKREIRFGVTADLKQVDREMGSFEKKFRATAQRAAEGFGDSMNHKIRQVKGELETLSQTDINIDADAATALAQLAEVKAYLETMLQDQTISIDVRSDIKGAVAELAAYQKAIAAIDPEVERVSGAFERKMRAAAKAGAQAIGDDTNDALRSIKARLATLGDVRIGVDMDAEEARTEIRKLETQLRYLAKESPDIDVNVAASAAMAELYAFRVMLNKLDGREVDIKVKTNAATAAASMGLLNRATALFTPNAEAAGGAGQSAANSFRSFNFMILGAVVLLPALIPMIAALAGGLLALLPILGALVGGLGVAVIGFSGIGDAVKAMGDAEKNAAKDSEVASQKMRDAAYAVADAQRNLADARRSAGEASADAARAVADAERQAGRASADAARAVADARKQAADAIENAIDRQRKAQEAYRDSVKEVHQAEKDLVEARKAGFQEIDDTDDAIRQNKLDERQGVVDVFNATVTNDAVQHDGSSTNLDKEQSSINLEQARLRLAEIREEEKRLAAEKKKQDKAGVNGTEAVQNAQDALTSALEKQQEAQESLGDAAAAVDEARVDGARNVQDALRNQAESAADAARAIADAHRSEADAQRNGARSIADAQRNLAKAQERYQDALTETGEIGSAATRKLEDAMGKLSPAGQRFAKFIFGLRKGFREVRDAIQEAMLPPIQRALTAVITKYGPGFERWAGRMAGVVGGFFESMGDRLVNSSVWQDFFAMIDSYGPGMLKTFGETSLNWLEIFAKLMTILAPYGERLNNALLGISERTLDWMDSAKGTQAWVDFMDYAFRVGPAVADFFWNFARAAAAIGVALAPWGEMVMGGLSALFDYIAEMDPALLGLIATSLVTIAIAFQLAVGAAALAFAGAAVFASAGSRYVFFAVLIAGALAGLYHRFEFVRDIVDSLTGFLKDHMGAIKTLIGLYIAASAAMKIYNAFLIGGAIYTRYIIIYTKIYAAIQKVQTAIQWAQNAAMAANPMTLIVLAIIAVIAVLVVLFKKNKRFHDFVIRLWEKLKDVAVDVWGAIVDAFWWLVDAAKSVWAVIQPIFAAIGRVFRWLWEHIVKPYLGFVVSYWVRVFKIMRGAWNNVLWPVIDLITTAIRKLWVGAIKKYLGFMLSYWRHVFSAMKWAYDHTLGPLFSLIGTAIAKLWNKYASPFFGKIGDAWDVLARGMHLVWVNKIKPIFDTFKDKVLPKLQTAFGNVIHAIKTAWGRLKGYIGKPIKWVINTVVRDGIVKGFNKVADFVGSKPIKFEGVDWKFANGGTFGRKAGKNAFADGGMMPGYTPGRDVHHFVSPTGGRLHLSGGEPILRPEVGKVVGRRWVDRVNAAARSGGVAGVKRVLGAAQDQRFARGGIVNPYPGSTRSTYPGHDGIDLNRPGDNGPDGVNGGVYPYYSATNGRVSYTGTARGYGNAVFVQSPYGELVYGHSYPGSVKVRAGQAVKAGQQLAVVGNTGHSTGAHLHFGFPGGSVAQAAGILNAAGAGDYDLSSIVGALHTGGGSGFPGWLTSIAKNPLGYVKGKINGGIDKAKEKFKEFSGSNLGKMMFEVPRKLASSVAGKIWDMIPGPLQEAVGGVKAAFKGAKELGGKALDGIENVGDFIGGLGGRGGYALAPAGPSDSGEYYRGGILPDNGTMMYDNGGYLPPGLTSVVNLTGKPEPVFTQDQFGQIQGGGEGGESFTYAPTFNKSDLTASDVVTDMDRAYRKMKRRSKYGGQG